MRTCCLEKKVSSPKRYRRKLRNDSLCNGRDYMVAGTEKLASQPQSKLGIASCSIHLGYAQRTWLLVLFLHSDVGNLRHLFFFSTSVSMSLPHGLIPATNMLTGFCSGSPSSISGYSVGIRKHCGRS